MTEYRCILAAPDLPDGDVPVVDYYEIACAMRRSEMWRPSKGCHLWIRLAPQHLGGAVLIANALEFRYRSNAVWIRDRYDEYDRYGRISHAHFALCTDGDAPPLVGATRVTALFQDVDPSPHKVPPKAYALIEKVSSWPRLEMFATQKRDGWDVWTPQ